MSSGLQAHEGRGRTPPAGIRRILPTGALGVLGPLLVALVIAGLALLTVACTSDGTSDGSTTSTSEGSAPSGDIDGTVGEDIEVGEAVVTVRALQETFHPASPEQRMSEQTPVAPEGGESFYQAYVKVENGGTLPLRVDPQDFACALGDTVVGVEPTRSGPAARSLLKNSSLDLLLTFKGPAGYEPVLLYSPSWYDGTIRVVVAPTEPTT
jgi:hypothetical protein